MFIEPAMKIAIRKIARLCAETVGALLDTCFYMETGYLATEVLQCVRYAGGQIGIQEISAVSQPRGLYPSQMAFDGNTSQTALRGSPASCMYRKLVSPHCCSKSASLMLLKSSNR